MKILVVGAGPAGLVFASLVKRENPQHDITVVEKGGSTDGITGWGVVVPGRPPRHPANILSYVPGFAALQPQFLSRFDSVHQEQHVLSDAGVELCAVERPGLVHAMRQHCAELGVELRFGTSAHPEEYMGKADLVVMATGVPSLNSAPWHARFIPHCEFGTNKYFWFGTRQVFDNVTFIFREYQGCVFIAHAYKYREDASSIIIECSEKAYLRTNLHERSAADARHFLAEVFQAELGGHELLEKEGAVWRNFATIGHAKAVSDNIALLGDALQTGHFSIGHGTTMAVVASRVLARALKQQSSVPAALACYEQEIIPLMRLFATHADASRQWFETVEGRMQLAPSALVESFHGRRAHLPPLPPALGAALGGGPGPEPGVRS